MARVLTGGACTASAASGSMKDHVEHPHADPLGAHALGRSSARGDHGPGRDHRHVVAVREPDGAPALQARPFGADVGTLKRGDAH
jgi:hypothetical protein